MANFAENRKAHFNYEILEKYEAGIELFGYEVKSVKAGHATLDGTRVLVRGGEAYIVGMSISPYQVGNTPPTYDPARTRRLLLKKLEIEALGAEGERKGLTIVPLALYSKKSLIKVSVAVVRGKKQFDKRETIKKRDTDRELRRSL